jgi:predicted outer membrane protein
MLKKFIFSLASIVALSLIAVAQGDKTTLTGFIVDKNCATSKDAKASDPQAAAGEEPKGCVLMESCVNSGLGVYADGKYVQFDKKGVDLAKAALQKSKKDKGAKFEVTGKVTGGTMAVDDIKEVE